MPRHLLVALGWALLHFVWQGAVLAGALRAFGAAARRGPAAPRYAAACATLALMLASFAATAWRQAGRAAATDSRRPAPLAVEARAADPTRRGVAGSTPAGRGDAPLRIAPTFVRPVVDAAAAAARADLLDRALPAVALGWALGVAVLSARLAGGWVLARRLVTRHVARAPAACERQLRRLRAELGVRAPVRLLVSARVAVPAVLGWLRPVVLLPAGAVLGLTPAELEFLLRHELAHVLRRDYLANLLQRVAEVLLFYHPAVWWVSREIGAAREQCCDELAVGAGDVGDYLRALAAVEALRGPSPRPALALGADGASLLGRARHLARRAADREAARAAGWRGAARAGAAALCLGAAGTSVLAGASGPTFRSDPPAPGARPAGAASDTADPTRARPAGAPGGAAEPGCAPRRPADPLTLCPALGARAAAALAATGRDGAVVVQEVATGALLAYAATSPAVPRATPPNERVDVTSAAVPASVWKLLTAALWWDHGLPDGAVRCPPVYRAGARRVTAAAPGGPAGTVEDMLAHSCNTAAVDMTLRLRDALGPDRLLAEYGRLGFPTRPPPGDPAGATAAARDSGFWASSSPAWRARMAPAASGARLAPDAPDAAWADVALGQAAVRVTPLHLSRFLQAVGAGGREHPPTVETARAAHAAAAPGRRIMRPATAARLQGALRAAVDRGTAAGVRPLLAGGRWRLGGKTGTAGDGAGGPSDGWFVGLVFDERGAARYTVVVYVRGGGAGGGVPARLAASLTRFLAGDGGGPEVASVR